MSSFMWILFVDYVGCVLSLLFYFFFFQAEDGIRDLVRSRGLGDVYKRQVYDVVETGTGKRDNSLLWVITTAGSNRSGICYEAVSYTHLTLPTSDLV